MSQNETPETAFKKGMTLNEYISQMKPSHQQAGEDKEETEDLYQTSRRIRPTFSKKLISFEIRESDQDNYDESNDGLQLHQRNNMSTQMAFYDNEKSKKNLLPTADTADVKNSLSNSRGFRVRQQSNSPFSNIKKDQKNDFSPNKNLSRTLHNSEWKVKKSLTNNNPILPSNTLYGQFLKGLKEPERSISHSKEKLFKKKNTKDIEHVLKYEKSRNSKYAKYDEKDLCVEGITERFGERKYISKRNMK